MVIIPSNCQWALLSIVLIGFIANQYQQLNTLKNENQILQLNLKDDARFPPSDIKAKLDGFDQAISSNQCNSTSLIQRAILRKRTYHQFSTATADLNKAILCGGSDMAEALFQRGLIYRYHLNKIDLAMEDFNNAIQANGEYASAYFERGKIYEFHMKPFCAYWEKAVSDYRTAIKKTPKRLDMYYGRLDETLQSKEQCATTQEQLSAIKDLYSTRYDLPSVGILVFTCVIATVIIMVLFCLWYYKDMEHLPQLPPTRESEQRQTFRHAQEWQVDRNSRQRVFLEDDRPFYVEHFAYETDTGSTLPERGLYADSRTGLPHVEYTSPKYAMRESVRPKSTMSVNSGMTLSSVNSTTIAATALKADLVYDPSQPSLSLGTDTEDSVESVDSSPITT